MKAWDDLVAIALRGSGEAPKAPALSGESAALDALLSRLAAQPGERSLLAAAAVLATWRRSGLRPLPSGPAPALAPPEERPPCPAAATEHLLRILQDKDLMPLLPEWLAALDASGHALPPRWLPDLLDLAVQRKELRPLVCPLLGPRGAWLAAQHPAWASLLLPVERAAIIERWQTGALPERLEILQQTRQADPALGLELLTSTWAQEPPRERQAFLQALGTGLTMADEPFLEAALDDRRKDVRLTAAALLAVLPGSRLCERMLGRLAPLLHFSAEGHSGLAKLGLGRKASLEVTLSEECDKAMLRDGLDADGIEGLGRRHGCLAQMLGMVAPETWCRRWDIDPPRALAAVAKTEWEDAFLVGWAHAAARYHDAAWADALISVLLHKVPQAREKIEFQADRSAERAVKLLYGLWPALAPARLEALVLEALHSQPRLQNAHAALPLLEQCRYPWSETLGRAVLQGLQMALRKGDPLVDDTSMVRPRLKEYALYMLPSLAAQATEGWAADRLMWNASWRGAVEQFQAVLRFRHDMLAALPPTPIVP